MSQEPSKLEARQPGDQACQLGGLGRRLDARAPEAGVAVDEVPDRDAVGRRGVRESLGGARRVACHRQPDPGREAGGALHLLGADEGERDQDVLDPGVGHHLRLAELLAGDPDRTCGELQAGDLRQLVGLRVRAQRQPVCVAVGLHRADVALDDVEIDGEERRGEVG